MVHRFSMFGATRGKPSAVAVEKISATLDKSGPFSETNCLQTKGLIKPSGEPRIGDRQSCGTHRVKYVPGELINELTTSQANVADLASRLSEVTMQE